MGFMEKIRNSFEEVVDSLEHNNSSLHKVIQDSKDMMNAELRLNKESMEGINRFKEYALNETPGFKNAMVSFHDALYNISRARKEMVNQYQQEFIAPLDDLVQEFNKLSNEINQEKHAVKSYEKLSNKFEKLKSKSLDKLKPGELESFREKMDDALKVRNQEREDVIQQTSVFKRKKIETLDLALKNVVKIQLNFFDTALKEMKKADNIVKNINIEKENDIILEKDKKLVEMTM